MALKLAALLHDADDHKYFKYDKVDADDLKSQFRNASAVMEGLVDEATAQEVLMMISHVSASKNGNRVPELAKTQPEILWPRFCDRLEAIGFIGALRCYQVNMERK